MSYNKRKARRSFMALIVASIVLLAESGLAISYLSQQAPVPGWLLFCLGLNTFSLAGAGLFIAGMLLEGD